MAYKCSKKQRNDLARRYNISPLIYRAIIQGANNSCMICGYKAKDDQVLCIDHCHETGKSRGYLCNSCNWLISNAKDDVRILQNAIKYLEES